MSGLLEPSSGMNVTLNEALLIAWLDDATNVADWNH
jgi:hypothetical protein